MILPRTLRTTLLLAATGLAVGSCISPPEYPDTPEIEFKRITQERITDATGTYDKVVIIVAYKDGDGDLGLRSTDTSPPFNVTKPDNTLNPDGYNYICRLQVRDAGGNFQDIVFSPNDPGYDGRYPRLTPDDQGDRKAPLKGDIDYTLQLFKNSVLRTGTVLRFKIKIKDRALHVSNEVVTDALTLQP
ncbi:hypothetical protein [Hymenobacter metallilatus]|uniref:Lipoprotein n=1 Tax=Hymenobacter metallilatus TaxID=2493666 RepID=A0A428JCB2_9BACT|nr:hypothetical protein [Hymenobacter metallilatus]RSK29524.1 hypothetical protein EI290_16760 [Hymenobacter metallilatus]